MFKRLNDKEMHMKKYIIWLGKILMISLILFVKCGIKSSDTEESIQDDPMSSEECKELSISKEDQLLQLDISGITDDETERLKYIIAENREEIEEHLRNDPRDNKAIRFGSFDFTGDGIEEIIYEKGFVDYVPFTYTYILDRDGTKLSEFAWTNLDQTDIYISEENVYYLSYYSMIAADNCLSLYGEIRYDGKGLEQKLLFMEWDVRYDIDIQRNVKDGYSVYGDLKKEEADKLWNGREGIAEISKTKENIADKNVLEEYKEKWSNMEPAKVAWLGAIIYSEEDDDFSIEEKGTLEKDY